MTVYPTFFDIFEPNLNSVAKFMIRFPDVLMRFINSKVCLLGEWSIVAIQHSALFTRLATDSDCFNLYVQTKYV